MEYDRGPIYPYFLFKAGREGHLYDFVTSYVSFSPGSMEEMEVLDATIWRYLYPYQVVSDIRAAEGRVYAE